MNNNNNSLVQSIIQKTALDWIPIIFRDSLFKELKKEHPRPSVARHLEIKKQTATMDLESLKFVIPEHQKLLASEEKRREEIDSKASTLIGFTGIASGVVIAFGPFLLDLGPTAPLLGWILRGLYLSIGVSLIFTIILALRTIEVGRTQYMEPQPDALLALRNSNKTYTYRQLAADLYRSYEHNRSLINDKSAYAGAAQAWFRNTVSCLFLLIFAFAVGSLDSGGMATPQELIIITPTPPVSTQTPDPSILFTPQPTSTSAGSATPVSPSPQSISTSTIMVTPVSPTLSSSSTPTGSP